MCVSKQHITFICPTSQCSYQEVPAATLQEPFVISSVLHLLCCLHFQAGVTFPSPVLASTSSSLTDRRTSLQGECCQSRFSSWNTFNQCCPANAASCFYISIVPVQTSGWWCLPFPKNTPTAAADNSTALRLTGCDLDACGHKFKTPRKRRLWGNNCCFSFSSLKFCVCCSVECNHGGHRLRLLSCSHLLLHVHRLLAVLLQQEDLLLRHALCDGGDWTRQRWLGWDNSINGEFSFLWFKQYFFKQLLGLYCD